MKISGSDEGSKQKFNFCSVLDPHTLFIITESSGKASAFELKTCINFCLSDCRAGQVKSRCSRSSRVSTHVGARQYPSLLLLLQNLHCLSVLYLPVIILAITSLLLATTSCFPQWMRVEQGVDARVEMAKT